MTAAERRERLIEQQYDLCLTAIRRRGIDTRTLATAWLLDLRRDCTDHIDELLSEETTR